MEIFDPVGIVHAVFAAFDELGRVARSLADCSLGSAFTRGPDELAAAEVELVAGGLEIVEDDADEELVEVDVLAVFSSPN
jgi:hypothetical protein